MDIDLHMRRVIDNLSVDLSTLSSESKRKYPPVKEASESCLLKLRQIGSLKSNLYKTLCDTSLELIQPLIIGCDTKQPKLIQICLTSIQKVIEAKILNIKSAAILIETLWQLTDSNLEELKVLQTIILLVNTTEIVQHSLLAKTISIGFRLCSSKDATIMHTATAMVSQMVTGIFERVFKENEIKQRDNLDKIDMDKLKTLCKEAPVSLGELEKDAFMFLQDLYLLLNSDNPIWLIGIHDINKPFGLELLKLILEKFSEIFFMNPEMSFLLKERICPLLIKLFSPSTKLKTFTATASILSNQNTNVLEKNYFSTVSRLIRIVFVLLKTYFDLLVTESEIFLSLLIKYLDNHDRPIWQKALAIELFHKVSIEPHLIRLFCVNYDMKQHPEKIFQGIVNGITLFMHTLFTNQSMNPQNYQQTQQQTTTSHQNQMSNGHHANITPTQPSFIYRDTYIPLLLSHSTQTTSTANGQYNQIKSIYLDTWDKQELPQIQETYLLSISFSTLQEIVRSIQQLVDIDLKQEEHQTNEKYIKQLNSPECLALVSTSCNSFLSMFNLLLESSVDENLTESILRSIRTYIYLCALFGLHNQRDAFTTVLCKAALPSNYANFVLNLKLIDLQLKQQNHAGGSPSAIGNLPITTQTNNNRANSHDDFVIAIGPALNSFNSITNISLTSKNLLTLKFILSMSQEFGEYYGTSWHIILNTMQHLSWTLSLKPVAGSNGFLKHINSTTDNTNTTTITTAIQNEIAAICSSLTKLFEITKDLSEQTLVDVIEALIKLSLESVQIQNMSNKTSEPCLFAIAKLYETSVSNIYRIEIIWTKVTSHLLEICKYPNIKLREWCVDSICSLIKTTFSYPFEKPLNENHELKQMFLLPLEELSFIQFFDIRQKQIECTLTILRSAGATLNYSWPLCLTIIGAINKDQNETLIRSAFQCLQLVVTDFLTMMRANYLSSVIRVVSKFGHQEVDLNISLTAIVLLWNISDYMYQNNSKLAKELETVSETAPKGVEHTTIEAIWMVLYSKLGELCVDSRPAVRKSAGQTLFCTISSHSSILSDKYWQELVTSVLFKLLDEVKTYLSTASKERDSQASAVLLMHHSRDTAEKQWAETNVLSLAGVARVFNSKCSTLIKLNDFHKMWLLLLEHIENSASSPNNEISLSALRSLHELLGNNSHQTSSNVNSQAAAVNNLEKNDRRISDAASPSSVTSPVSKYLDVSQWLAAWKAWLNIGVNISYGKDINSPHDNNDTKVISKRTNSVSSTILPPNQVFLTCYVDLIPIIIDLISFKFTKKDFEMYSTILDKLLSMPVVGSDYASFVFSQTDKDVNLSPLQNACLNSVKHFIKLSKSSEIFEETFIPLVFERLLSFSLYSCQSSANAQYEKIPFNSTKANDFISVNCVSFGEKSLVILTSLYDECAQQQSVIDNQIFKKIIQTLHTPLQMKYACPMASTWKLAIECLFKIMRKGLPIAFKNRNHPSFEPLWLELARLFEEFLFTKNVGNAELTIDVIHQDELTDCQIIEFIRDEIFSSANLLPPTFIQKILAILNRGSIYSNTTESFLDLDSTRKLREEFSKTCFETLLKFSFINNNNSNDSLEGSLTKMALASMLNRCKEIIQRYAHDERLNGSVPLPRARTNEMICVLRSLCTLISSLKKAPKEAGLASIWNQVIGLYPCLVECTTSPSTHICATVKDALHHYFSLLNAPNCT